MNSAFKQELIDKISATNNDELLQILNADYEYFTKTSETDVLDNLSEGDREELMILLKEPFAADTETYDDFKKATERWRTESL